MSRTDREKEARLGEIRKCVNYNERERADTMRTIKKKDIAGLWFDPEIVCTECISDVELKNLKADQIIIHDQICRDDETLYFCNRCQKQLWREHPPGLTPGA